MKLALTVREMLDDAIDRHAIENFGKNPAMFEMHPEVIAALKEEISTLMALLSMEAGGDFNIMYYKGVKIVPKYNSEPVMLTARGQYVPI